MSKNKALFLILAGFWGFRMLRKYYNSTVDKEKEIDLLARTAWGEARGEGVQGMKMVMYVIMNRVKKGGWWGATVADVVKKPGQFSAWNTGDPNREKMENVTKSDFNFNAAMYWAPVIYAGQETDPTNGATHYHTTGIRPAWADDQKIVAQYGKHIFYKGIA